MSQVTALIKLVYLSIATLIGGLGICIFIPLTLFNFSKPFGKTLLNSVSIFWANCVRFLLTKRLFGVEWQITGTQPSNDKTYLLLANHQSWIDIFAVLVAIGNDSPVPKFFMKKELLWVPVIGLAGFALGFPVMHRKSATNEKLNKSRHSGDLNRGRKALDLMEKKPTIIAIFPEGTRFTKHKHKNKKSPFTHLLQPKAGGSQIVFQSLGDQLNEVLDITLDYPNSTPNFWQFLSGKIPIVKINIESIKPPAMNNQQPKEKKANLSRAWINERWRVKDELLIAQRSDKQDVDDTNLLRKDELFR